MGMVEQGLAALAAGRPAEAAEAFRLALMQAPGDADALAGLGRARLALGAAGEAALLLLAALERAPGDEGIQSALCRLAERVAAEEDGIRLPTLPGEGALLALLACERVDLQDFAFLVAGHLRRNSPFAQALRMPSEQAAEWLASPAGADALADRVLLAALARLVNFDPGIERALTALRRRVLSGRLWKGGVAPAFLAALARQCAANEYVWPETAAEAEALAALEADIAARMRERRKLGAELSAYACYRPLVRLPSLADPGKRAKVTDSAARALAEEAAREAAELARARQRIAVLAPLSGGVSEAVARQYEENPYPRWLSASLPEPGSRLPAGMQDCDVAVLVAGCGTGKQAVRAAIGYGPRARLLAVDLSRSSLAYAARMAARFGARNVEFAQADILALGGLDRRFDVIECTGVLHHLADPMAGWRVLAGLLKPGGTMRVALYSRAARAPVEACRKAIAGRGLSSSDDDIRAFRAELMEGGGPAPDLASLSGDMFTLSGIRDLLFHVQETAFTLPEIKDRLARLGLEFTGFGMPAEAAARLLAEVGVADPAAATLDDWDRVERRNPATFRRMYQFSCRKPPMEE